MQGNEKLLEEQPVKNSSRLAQYKKSRMQVNSNRQLRLRQN